MLLINPSIYRPIIILMADIQPSQQDNNLFSFYPISALHEGSHMFVLYTFIHSLFCVRGLFVRYLVDISKWLCNRDDDYLFNAIIYIWVWFDCTYLNCADKTLFLLHCSRQHKYTLAQFLCLFKCIYVATIAMPKTSYIWLQDVHKSDIYFILLI